MDGVGGELALELPWGVAFRAGKGNVDGWFVWFVVRTCFGVAFGAWVAREKAT